MDWSKTHCGVFKCPWLAAINLQPELREPLEQLENSGMLEYPVERYVVDSKIHMLMPGQYPCIPNWHYDMVPRDVLGNQDFSMTLPDQMYLWLSNGPLTEFEDGFTIPRKWKRFTQSERHRGTVSNEFTWRAFIRVCPDTILTPGKSHEWMRRHCQVYLDAANFNW